MKFANIVFMQGHEAEEPLNILDTKGFGDALDYLLQWDNGEYYDITEQIGKGDNDTQVEVLKNGRKYLINYNSGIGYIGLELVIPEPILLLDSNRGIYIPLEFVNNVAWTFADNSNITEFSEDIAEIKKGVDGEYYWDGWDNILNGFWFEKSGIIYDLYQDGDLWAVPYGIDTDVVFA